MNSYDCTKEVEEHIKRVRKFMNDFSIQIKACSKWHDSSKLREPEKSVFDEYIPKLKELVFGSEEYKAIDCNRKARTCIQDSPRTINIAHVFYIVNILKKGGALSSAT
jgi:hypothetical protein